METRAERDGDDFVLDGAKTLVTNAPICDLAVVYAATTPGAGGRGITAFLVESSRDGMRRAARLDTMGLRTAEIGDIVLERCRVPADRVVGEVGGGAACFQCAMEWERGCILAMHLGRMRRQIERATDYARRRRQFGRPIGSFQSIANRIVDMKIRLDAARPLLYRVGARKDEGHGAVLEAAVAKIFLSDAAIASSEDAIQVFGGLGYTRPFEVERDLRDAIGARLYSGTSEIQRTLVARLIGLPSSTSPPPPPGGRLAPRTG
jgi:alkylation response protein AidB-like acyl-CoA dehydrogenase